MCDVKERWWHIATAGDSHILNGGRISTVIFG
jgi:hypothetical protein